MSQRFALILQEKECNMQTPCVVTPKHLSPSYEAQTNQHFSKRMVTETFAEDTFYNHKPGKTSSFLLFYCKSNGEVSYKHLLT